MKLLFSPSKKYAYWQFFFCPYFSIFGLNMEIYSLNRVAAIPKES